MKTKTYNVTILCPKCHHDTRLHGLTGCKVMKPNAKEEKIGIDESLYCPCTKSYYWKPKK